VPMKIPATWRHDGWTVDTKLGSCCACGSTWRVRNVMLLPFKAPIAGQGWGCAVCHLAMDGAVAVLCDGCFLNNRAARFVCAGYPKADQRVPIEDITVGAAHAHDHTKHPELRRE